MPAEPQAPTVKQEWSSAAFQPAVCESIRGLAQSETHDIEPPEELALFQGLSADGLSEQIGKPFFVSSPDSGACLSGCERGEIHDRPFTGD